VVSGGTLVGVGYATTPTPQAPKADVTNEGSHVYFADGKAQIFPLGVKRQLLNTQQMGDKVRFAAMAAEDMGFMSESGISPRGMARALWNTATGTQTQGGSTITQQLARNYYQGLSQQRTVSRKFREIFASIKLSQNLSHDEILTRYLNTIDFGRQSSGIGQAAHSYFGKDASQLDWNQAAMLGALIQQPGYFHSQPGPGLTATSDPAYMALVNRWHYVLGNLVKMGKITAADAASMQFPVTNPNWDDATNKGSQTAYIKARVQEELQRSHITDAETQGYKIYTSLNQTWMKYAEQVMKDRQVGKWPQNVREGLIAVDPKDGSVKAFWGGNPQTDKSQVDSVFSRGAQVGSSFKPYVLATALKLGFNVKSMINGASPQTFDLQGNDLPDSSTGGYTVHNDSGDGPMGVIDLVKGLAQSVNTAYVKLYLTLGGKNVAATAEKLGIPKEWISPHVGAGGQALGIDNISAAEQAAGYSAFANGGYAVQPHLVSRVVDKNGKDVPLYWQPDLKKAKDLPVLTKDQADQMTYALRQVVEKGTASHAALPDRPAAGKTGTTEGNHAGWFVGYTPPGKVQLTTAVTMYNTKASGAITGIPGFSGDIYGGTIPAEIWSSFMQKVDANSPPGTFNDPNFAGEQHMWDTPSATPKTASPHNTCKPNQGGNNGGLGNFGGGQPTCGGKHGGGGPGGNTQPCSAPGIPFGCNDSLPPPVGTPYHQVWCNRHKKDPSCQTTTTPPGNGGPGNGGGGPGTPTGQSLLFRRISG
jgi:membrane peptidoglycan carboxypeptidase